MVSTIETVPAGDGAALTLFPSGRKSYRGVNADIMTRRLVLSHESAGHPFRRALPPPVIQRARDDDHDWKLFLLSFVAFFTCFYTFLL